MKVMIIPNFDKQNALPCTREVCSRLASYGVEVLMEEKKEQLVQLSFVQYGNLSDQLEACDAVIAIGGDGTIIHAAKSAVKFAKPVLGINTGRLGFLAGLEQDELNELKCLVTGEYQIEERMMLEVVHTTKQRSESYLALNDAVVSKGALSRMIDLNIYCMGRFVTSYRADGIILSTPTGSTAYALSAGGPIIEPNMNSISLTPISPHSLFDRTILFSAENELTIETVSEQETEVYLTIDGETGIRLSSGDGLLVKKSHVPVKMIRIQNRAFYEVLNQKFLMRAEK